MAASDAPPAPSFLRTVGQAALLGLAYAAAVRVAGAISVPNVSIAPIRLPNAIAIAALLLTPPSSWWLYLLAIVPLNLRPGDPLVSVLYVAANSLEIVSTAAVLRLVSRGRPRLDDLRNCLAFVAVGVILAPLVSGFIGAFAVQRIYPTVAFASSWRVWWFGDAVGNVAVVPALLALMSFRARLMVTVRPARIAEALTLIVLIVAGSLPTLGIFGPPGGSSVTAFSMLYVPFPLLVWAGLRFGAPGAAGATLLLAALSILSALEGRGPFAQPDNGSGVLILQQFIVVSGATAVTLAGVVDERRRTLTALLDSEGRYRSLFDTATDVIVTTDLNGRLLTANAAFEAITGWTHEEWFGRPLTAFLDPAEAPEAMRHMQATAAGIASAPQAWRVRISGGEWRIADVKASLFTQGGRAAGVLLIARDITERQRAEEDRARLENEIAQSRKLEAVGQLAGGIAHDFNNLLQAILGFAELTREYLPPDSRGLANLDIVTQAGERARDLTRQLLTFSRREVLHPEILDVAAAVNEIGHILRRVLPASVRLQISSAPATPPVLAERGHVDQIVMNLCVNARDAMPDGGDLTVAVGVRTLDAAFVAARSWAREGEFVTIEVGDSGEGIPAEFLPRIFEPFFTTKGVGRGTGLGLATVYAIVKRYGGVIGIDTAVGRGTTITVYLPPSAGTVAAPAAAVKAQTSGGRGELILVAEDESAVRELAVKQLTRAGYRVVAARDGADALRLFADHEPDVRLVFLDVMMPNGDGRHVRRIIGDRRPGVPILFASGFDDRGERQGEAIADPLIEKPYSGASLLVKVRELLDRRQDWSDFDH
jgi:two-component system cell cycle sensor histidine kinase/response regulator CckA